MKAIQVRFLGETNTQPSRYKVMMEQRPTKFYSKESFGDLNDDREYYAAVLKRYCEDNNIDGYDNMRYGMIPNGDWVFCFNSSIISFLEIIGSFS